MLSDAERRRPAAIEDDLWSEDPEFAERFGRVMLRRPEEWRGMSPGGWLLTAVLLMGLAVLMASSGMALIALSAAGVSAGMWLTRHLRSSGDRPPRP
jgi:hypothetical protein